MLTDGRRIGPSPVGHAVSSIMRMERNVLSGDAALVGVFTSILDRFSARNSGHQRDLAGGQATSVVAPHRGRDVGERVASPAVDDIEDINPWRSLSLPLPIADAVLRL
jgi:hypothetical protein